MLQLANQYFEKAQQFLVQLSDRFAVTLKGTTFTVTSTEMERELREIKSNLESLTHLTKHLTSADFVSGSKRTAEEHMVIMGDLTTRLQSVLETVNKLENRELIVSYPENGIAISNLKDLMIPEPNETVSISNVDAIVSGIVKGMNEAMPRSVSVTNLEDIQEDQEPDETVLDRDANGDVQRVIERYGTQKVVKEIIRDIYGNIVRTKIIK